MSYKEQFFEHRKEEMKTKYSELRGEKKTRDEALKIMQPIFGLTPASMKVIMFDSNYGKTKRTKKPNT